MEDTSDDLPDIGIFKIQDVIDGPLEVLLWRGKKWDVPHYERVVVYFREVSGLDREALTCNSENKYCQSDFIELVQDVSCCFVLLYSNLMLLYYSDNICYIHISLCFD